MSDTNSAILGEAARQARRLVDELQSRQNDLEKSNVRNIVEAELDRGRLALATALAEARKTLETVERELSEPEHPSDSMRSS
jgi:Sec-independent protein translocase protein TatA